MDYRWKKLKDEKPTKRGLYLVASAPAKKQKFKYIDFVSIAMWFPNGDQKADEGEGFYYWDDCDEKYYPVFYEDEICEDGEDDEEDCWDNIWCEFPMEFPLDIAERGVYFSERIEC